MVRFPAGDRLPRQLTAGMARALLAAGAISVRNCEDELMEATAWCPKCGAEYRPGFTMCADCRVALVDHPPVAAARTAHPDRRFVELARVPTLEARMLVNRLRASGAASADVGAEPIYGSFNFAEGVPVVVADDELDLARQLLTEDAGGRDGRGLGPVRRTGHRRTGRRL